MQPLLSHHCLPSECPSQRWFSSWQGGSQGSHQLWQDQQAGWSLFLAFLLLVCLVGFLYTPNQMFFLVFPWSLYSDKIFNVCFLGSQAEGVMNFSPSFKSDKSLYLFCVSQKCEL